MSFMGLLNAGGAEATSSIIISYLRLSGTLGGGGTYTSEILRCRGLPHQFFYVEQTAGVAGGSFQIEFAVSDFDNAGTQEFRFLPYNGANIIPFSGNAFVNTHIPAVAVRLVLTAGGGAGNIFNVVVGASAS